MGIIFQWDSSGIVVPESASARLMYESPLGYDVVDADVKFNELGEVVLAMSERNADVSVRLLSTGNVHTGQYDVISSGDCQVLDSYGDCYTPYLYSTRWSPDGDAIYFSPIKPWSEDYRKVIARIRWLGGSWSQPELVMETAPGHRSLNLGSISAAVLMTFRVDEIVTNKRGKVMGLRRADGVVDLANCTPAPCWSDDGAELPSLDINQSWIWTPSESLLIKEDLGVTTALGEMTDPITGARAPLKIEGVRAFDSSL